MFPDTAGEFLLSAAPTDSKGAYLSDLPVVVGQLSPPALSTAGQMSLPAALRVDLYGPTMWFKDYVGTA